MKVVLFGCNGQLGQCLQNELNRVSLSSIGFSHSDLDITNTTQVHEALKTSNPTVVINAAAYTKVDLAEDNEEQAFLVNAKGPEIIASSCKALSIPLIHISTDYVFDGKASRAYQPEDKTNPQSVYGKSKLAGEHAIQSISPHYMILRTSWVFSQYQENFVKTMIRLSASKSSLSVVSDQIGCPTNAESLSGAIVASLKRFIDPDFQSGIFHYASCDQCSWNIFAEAIFEILLANGHISQPLKVIPIPTHEYFTAAIRPMNSALDSQKFLDYFVQEGCNWRDSLESTITAIIKKSSIQT